MTDAKNRIGLNTVDEIKKHPWFKGIDWSNIRKGKAPFYPQLSGDDDVKYFDKYEPSDAFKQLMTQSQEKSNKNKYRNMLLDKNIVFAGYTYNKDATIIGAPAHKDQQPKKSKRANLSNYFDDDEEEVQASN